MIKATEWGDLIFNRVCEKQSPQDSLQEAERIVKLIQKDAWL